MNSTIRVGVALLALVSLAACAAHRPDGHQANRQSPCGRGETMTCEERMGEAMNCFCADRDSLRVMFEMHTTY